MARFLRLAACLLTIVLPLLIVCESAAKAAAAAPGDSMHTIFLEEEDARGQSVPTKTRFEGYYRGTAVDPYVIDFDFEQMHGSGGGFLIFRETDTENFYELDLSETSTKLLFKTGGAYSFPVASSPVAFGTNGREFRIRLLLTANTFKVYDRDASTTTPILQWTDPLNRFPVGYNLSYYARPGADVCWSKVSAHPQSLSPFLNAWDIPGSGLAEGYRTAQKTGGSNVNMGNARYDLTFDNYSTSTVGYGSFNQYQSGQDGNIEYAFEATAYGAAFAYRVTSTTPTHLPASGYELRQTLMATQWGTLDSAGNFSLTASGPPVPPGTSLRILVTNSTHTVLLQDGTLLIPPQTNSSYKGLRAMFGYTPGSSGTIRGYQLTLP